MKIVIFGLSISSSWGNGHATLWRALCSALSARGHEVIFFERDVPYYASHRDLVRLPDGELILYRDWSEVRASARRHLKQADVAVATSYCPDAVLAEQLMMDARVFRVFYDLDAPVTLQNLREGKPVAYLAPHKLANYDLVLSYTGGQILDEIREKLHARCVAPLYGSLNPGVHRPSQPVSEYTADLSYLGTYSEDRQAQVEKLLVKPAAAQPERRFLIGGAQYSSSFPWKQNIYYHPHVPPERHPAFFCSSRLTLNVTRRTMADAGYCPSGRLFEAAGCKAALISDGWEGIDTFFEPGREILIAWETEDILAALELSDLELRKIAAAAHERVLEEHTAAHRVLELEEILAANRHYQPAMQPETIQSIQADRTICGE